MLRLFLSLERAFDVESRGHQSRFLARVSDADAAEPNRDKPASECEVLQHHRFDAIRITSVFQGLSIKSGVVHTPVPFVQHPFENQHLGLWERAVLHCLTVPFG
jgi:hypothetical protein